MFKFLCVFLVFALTEGQYLYGDDYHNYHSEYASAYDNYKPRDYKFEYGVSDPHTGDHKSQWEVRENGVVRGAYSLLEPDGTTRIVEYYADDTGFHADVKKIGTAVHAAPEFHATPIYKSHIADSIAYNGYGHGGLTHGYGAPIAAIQHVAPVEHKIIAAPIEHSAPIAHIDHIEPVHQVIAPQLIEKYAPAHYNYENIAKFAKTYAPIQKIEPIHYQEHYDEPQIYFKDEPIQYKEIVAKVAEPVNYQPQQIVTKIEEPVHYQAPQYTISEIIKPTPIVKYDAPIVTKIAEPIYQPGPALKIIKNEYQPIIKNEQLLYQPQILKEAYAPQVITKIAEPVYYQKPQIVKDIPNQQIVYDHIPQEHYAKILHAPQPVIQHYSQPIIKSEPRVEQYSYSAPTHYQEIEKPIPKQEYNQVAQIDEAILKFLSEGQYQKQIGYAQQPTYGYNHGH